MYEPSSAECLAPFHQDHTQRIAVLSMPQRACYLVFPVEALSRLAEGHEGSEIEWDEWKIHVVIPSIPGPDPIDFCVSACRLFSITLLGNLGVEVEVYDFSLQGRAKYLSEQANANLGGVKSSLASTGTKARLPWGNDEFLQMVNGHDSIVLFRVSVLIFSCAMRLNDVIIQRPDGLYGEEAMLHIWSF